MEDRIVTLETKLMAAEDLLDELNRTVWRQQQELDMLREQLRQLAQQVKTIQPGNPLRPEDEIPPHW
ncbi:Protein SlyX [Thauera sp. GDN1]|uniref:SlyX family protein n=1 Tax=Thauera sp. GDN1 TaxID=2944810 RepID=UPI002478C06A|nr:SlyX family protein [Thauera sp. GDN1]WEN41895.1 Protein SlyX [Thauera sp. GDN1]